MCQHHVGEGGEGDGSSTSQAPMCLAEVASGERKSGKAQLLGSVCVYLSLSVPIHAYTKVHLASLRPADSFGNPLQERSGVPLVFLILVQLAQRESGLEALGDKPPFIILPCVCYLRSWVSSNTACDSSRLLYLG